MTQLRGLESPGARQPFIGAVIDPRTCKPETAAGPGFRTRFNASGATGGGIAPALRAQAESCAKGKPVDEARLQQNITKARLVEMRQRAQREADIAARRGPAPSEPGLPSAVGYGDELRQVISDARRQWLI